MGRNRNKLEEISAVVSEENKKIALDPSSVLSPGVDYSSIDAQLSELEKLAAPHPLSASASVVSTVATHTVSKFEMAPQVLNPGAFIQSDRHQAVNATLTGKMAMGPSFAQMMERAIPQTQRDLVEQMQIKTQEIKVEDSPIPVEDDLLNYLMSKDEKSFGWVVDRSFLANFYINPEDIEEDAKFIFWSKPVNINLKRVSVTGFQRSEGTIKKIAPMIFFLNLVKAPDKEAAFTKMINDPSYANLRKELDSRGINFIYHIDPKEMIVSIQNRIAARST